MLGIHHYWAFVLSGILVNLTPGQDTLYVLGRSVAQGRRAGILSVLGICTGALIHTVAVAFGLSALLMASVTAYRVMKYAGAAYLVYLGVKMFTGTSEFADLKTTPEGSSGLSIYVQGMLTDLLNPNVILFYLAFLPQFVNPTMDYGALPFLLLGCTFITTGMTWCLIVACFAAAVSEHLRRKPRTTRVLRRVTGGLFVILGLRMALTGMK
jgi:threonine/homoserine/homoserine lactone efflux protein